MSARDPSGSGGPPGSPASMHGEPASSRKSPVEADRNRGSERMLHVPGAGAGKSLHVALLANRKAPAGWFPHTMHLRRIDLDAPEPFVVPPIEFSASVQFRSWHPSTAPPLLEP